MLLMKDHPQPGAPLPRDNSEYIREKISEYMTDRICPTCEGKRLRKEALAVRWMRPTLWMSLIGPCCARWNG